MERTVGTNRLIDGAKIDAISLNGGNKINTNSLANGNISDAELEALEGITGNIQDQIDNLATESGNLTPQQSTALEGITGNIETRLDTLETTDLGDVALKSGTNTFTGANIFENTTGFGRTTYGNPVSNASSNAITIDCSQSNNQKITVSENTTITFENLFQGTIFNFELNLTGVYTINFVCKALPGNTIVPMYSENGVKPSFTESGVYHMTLKMSAVACHFMTSGKFLEFTN